MLAHEYESKTEEECRQMEELAAKAERGERLDVVPGSVRHMDPNREVDKDQFFRDLHTEFDQMRLRRAEATQVARKTWKIRVPKDLDDKASQLAEQEGTNKSAIIRKAVAWYLQNTDKQPTAA